MLKIEIQEKKASALKSVERDLMFMRMDIRSTQECLTAKLGDKLNWLDGGMIDMRDRLNQADRVIEEVRDAAHNRLCDLYRANLYKEGPGD